MVEPTKEDLSKGDKEPTKPTSVLAQKSKTTMEVKKDNLTQQTTLTEESASSQKLRTEVIEEKDTKKKHYR